MVARTASVTVPLCDAGQLTAPRHVVAHTPLVFLHLSSLIERTAQPAGRTAPPRERALRAATCLENTKLSRPVSVCACAGCARREGGGPGRTAQATRVNAEGGGGGARAGETRVEILRFSL